MDGSAGSLFKDPSFWKIEFLVLPGRGLALTAPRRGAVLATPWASEPRPPGHKPPPTGAPQPWSIQQALLSRGLGGGLSAVLDPQPGAAAGVGVGGLLFA